MRVEEVKVVSFGGDDNWVVISGLADDSGQHRTELRRLKNNTYTVDGEEYVHTPEPLIHEDRYGRKSMVVHGQKYLLTEWEYE